MFVSFDVNRSYVGLYGLSLKPRIRLIKGITSTSIVNHCFRGQITLLIFFFFPGKEGKRVREKVRKLALKVEEDHFEDDLEMVIIISVFILLI